MGRSRTNEIIQRVEKQAERTVEKALSGLKIDGQPIATATLSVTKRKKRVKAQPGAN